MPYVSLHATIWDTGMVIATLHWLFRSMWDKVCKQICCLPAVCAVHDGYVLQKSITRSPLGGSLLTKCMLKAAESILAEKNFTMRPRYSIKRVERQPGVFEVR